MERNEMRRKVNRVEDKSKNKWKYIFYIVFVLMVFVYYQVFVLLKYTTGKTVTERQMSVYKWVASIVHKTEEVEQSNSLKINVVGNILVSKEVTEEYTENELSTYRNIFSNISFEEYDFNIANLNTAILKNASNNIKYNATTSLLDSIEDMNINLLVLSNKELSSQKADKITETENNIKAKNIGYIGTDTSSNPWYVLDKNGIKVGILSYIGSDYSKDNGLVEFNTERLKKDLKDIKSKEIDCIVVFVDTLRSNKESVNKEKEKELQELLNENVDIVISNDSVEQKLEEVSGKDGKTKYIKYGLGDVIGPQNYENTDISKTLKITIEKENKKVSVNVKEDKTLVALSNEAKTKYKIVDLEKAIKEYSGGNKNNITEAEYKYLCEIKEESNK